MVTRSVRPMPSLTSADYIFEKLTRGPVGD
jgi:hypothetical protein